MTDEKSSGGGTVIADSQGPATGGGGTMIASSSDTPGAPPPPPVGGGGTMIQDSGGGAAPAAVLDSPSMGMSMGSDLTGAVLLDRYEVTKQLGQGGMGTVYLGQHKTIGKKFAIKVLAAEFAHKPDLVERFLQEARAASMINQENVVEITDFGDTPDGSVFFVMEFLKGEDLSDTVKREGALPWARVKPIMLQVCRALQAAHDAGIIHRDMKPENCFRIKRGKNDDFIKVLDFGIAKVTSEEGEGGGKGLTRTGMIFGTPEYMSPEQAQGAKVDTRVDVYAAGVIMYELLTGRVPFTADTFMGILTKHMFEVPEAPSAIAPDAGIPPEAEAIVLKAMQKDREYRFQTMDEMAAAIEAVGTGAAAVNVVTEDINRPQTTGHMDFVGGPLGSTAPPMTIAPTGYDEPPKANRGLVFALIGALVVIAGGVGGFLAMNGGKGNEAIADGGGDSPGAPGDNPEDDPGATTGTVEEIKPEEDTEYVAPTAVKELDAKAEKVTLKIFTDVEADILDAVDLATYGKTNDEGGVQFEKSTDPISLVLRAPGYEDYPMEVVPNRDKPYHFEGKMEKKKVEKTASTKKPTKKTTKKASTTETPEDKMPSRPIKKDPDTTTKKKARPGGGINSPDLKDPFKK